MNEISRYEQPALLNVIALAARDPATDVAKFEALFRLQQEIIREQQAGEFKRGMSAVQAEMGPVVRDAKNEQTRSKYARLETIDAMLRPIYSKHGFGLSFNSVPLEGGNIRVECEVSHEAGHSKTYSLEAALDMMGAQGKVNKTPLHALGSSVSYLRRYLTTMIFNVTLTNEDDDGNAGNRPAVVRKEPEPSAASFEERAQLELENEPNGTKWLALLKSWLHRCSTTEQVAVIRGLPSFRTANEKAPSIIRAQLTEMMVDTIERLSPKDDHAQEAVEQMFDHVPAQPDPGDIMADILSDLPEISTAEEMRDWKKQMADKFDVLKRDDPKTFVRVITMIDEKSLQLEG